MMSEAKTETESEAKTEGYLLCCFGDQAYHRMACRSVQNIRLFDQIRPICILTDDVTYVRSLVTDIDVIHFDYQAHLHQSIDMSNDWNRCGLIPKLYQSTYTPFDITMFIDVDMIFKQDFLFIWDIFYLDQRSIMMPGLHDDLNRSPADWHWGLIEEVMKQSELNLPQVWSTLFVYDRSGADLITKDLDEIFNNLARWSVRSFYREGYPDEIIYSIILGLNSIPTNPTVHEWLLNEVNCDTFNKNC